MNDILVTMEENSRTAGQEVSERVVTVQLLSQRFEFQKHGELFPQEKTNTNTDTQFVVLLVDAELADLAPGVGYHIVAGIPP